MEKSQLKASTFFLYLFLILLSVICVLPFYIMIINSTHSNEELNKGLQLLPGIFLTDNYVRMSGTVNIWRGFLNSLIIASLATAFSAYFSSLTAYGFSKFKFKGNKALFWFVLGTMMVPGQLGLIGFFQLNKTLGLIDSFFPLILPSIASAGSVFFVKQYMDSSISNSLIESARIDGSSELKTFHRIILPLVTPSIAAVSIFNFVSSWNNYLTPMVILFSKDHFTIPILISSLREVYLADLGARYVAIALSIVPIVIMFSIMSKYIIGGLTMGAVKG